MTKIPTEIQKLAIEGGWHPNAHELGINWQGVEQPFQVTALDREFWLALFPKDDAFINARHFLGLILSGQDPIEFWAQLIAKDN